MSENVWTTNEMVELWTGAESLGYHVSLKLKSPFLPHQYQCTIFGFGNTVGSTVPCFQASSDWCTDPANAIRQACCEAPRAKAKADARSGIELPSATKPKLSGSPDDILKSLGLA